MEVTAEVVFAQALASNEKKYRDRALKKLNKYITARTTQGDGFSHEDLLKIWKGLHYCMWMQDKPLIQEELSGKISGLVHAFPNLGEALEFVNVFFITETREWAGIDRLRQDKFLMLIRHVLSSTFDLMSQQGWPTLACKNLASHMTSSMMTEENSRLPYALKLHLADIFVPELQSVPLDGLTGRKVALLLIPFIYFFIKSKRPELARLVLDKTVKFVLDALGHWPWQRPNKAKKRQGGRLRPPLHVIEDDDASLTESGEEADDEELESEESGRSGLEEMDNGSKTKPDDDDDDDDGGEESDDEQESNDGEGEEEAMEVDEEEEEEEDVAQGRVRVKFDLSMVLRMMLQLAGDPTLNIENRRRMAIYSFVKTYSLRDSGIVTPKDSDIEVAAITKVMGETALRKPEKRKRKKKRWQFEDETNSSDPNNNNITTVSVAEGKTSTEQTNQKKKKKKRKRKKNNMSDGTGDVNENKPQEAVAAEGKKRKRPSSSSDTETDGARREKMKKVRIEACGENATVTNGTGGDGVVNGDCVTTGKKKNKKKKKNEETAAVDMGMGEGNVNGSARSNSAPPPLSSPSGLSASTKGKKKSLVAMTSPVELVIYPPKVLKHSNKAASPTSLAKAGGKRLDASSPSSSVSDMSVVSDSFQSGASGKESKNGRGKKANAGGKAASMALHRSGSPPRSASGDYGQQGAAASPKSPGFLSSLMNVTAATPGNLIKKAVGMMALGGTPTANSNPGPSTDEAVKSSPDQKKVVFDLRKNKANKFTDYLNSLSKDTSPAFEPSRTPTQGILKSPSNVSQTSSPVIQMTLTPITGKRKGSPKLKPTRTRKSLSPVNKKKGVRTPSLKRLQ